MDAETLERWNNLICKRLEAMGFNRWVQGYRKDLGKCSARGPEEKLRALLDFNSHERFFISIEWSSARHAALVELRAECEAAEREPDPVESEPEPIERKTEPTREVKRQKCNE
jgi:hypothetical protein